MTEKISFKYHPNVYENGIIEHKAGVCQCCGREVSEYCIEMYTHALVSCICLECISNGSAAQKFDGNFVAGAETFAVDDPEKSKELFEKTPGYLSWHGEYWLACCNDYCAFIGEIGSKELAELGILDEVFEGENKSLRFLKNSLKKGSSPNGFLFQCLHCGKYRLRIDSN